MQQPLMIKTLSEVDIEETYLNIINVIYDRPIANITFKGVKPESSFFFLIRHKTTCLLLLLLFNTVLDAPGHNNQRGKEKKSSKLKRKK